MQESHLLERSEVEIIFLGLPVDVLQKLGEFVVGEVEPAGLRGTSVVSREIARLALVNKCLLPLVTEAWLALEHQTAEILHQLAVGDILKTVHWRRPSGQTQYYGPVNMQNFDVTNPRKHSPGLHALGLFERAKLQETLKSTSGPLAQKPPLAAGLTAARAPQAVQLTVALEKCQFFWQTPSPLWSNLAYKGTKTLEDIDILRELLTAREDRGLTCDKELKSLLDERVRIWPYGFMSKNTWWGARKLICDNWSPAELWNRQQERRKAAKVCLQCMDMSVLHCDNSMCTMCCLSTSLPCFRHKSPMLARSAMRNCKRRRQQLKARSS